MTFAFSLPSRVEAQCGRAAGAYRVNFHATVLRRIAQLEERPEVYMFEKLPRATA